MVSGSGAGLAYSFVRHDLKVKPAHALSWAAYLAVLCGTMYKVIDFDTYDEANPLDLETQEGPCCIKG